MSYQLATDGTVSAFSVKLGQSSYNRTIQHLHVLIVTEQGEMQDTEAVASQNQPFIGCTNEQRKSVPVGGKAVFYRHKPNPTPLRLHPTAMCPKNSHNVHHFVSLSSVSSPAATNCEKDRQQNTQGKHQGKRQRTSSQKQLWMTCVCSIGRSGNQSLEGRAGEPDPNIDKLNIFFVLILSKPSY